MRHKLSRTVLGLVVGVCLVGGLAPMAAADDSPANGTPFPTNGEAEVVENVGSDTSYFVVCDLAQKYTKNKPAGVNPGTGATRDNTSCAAGNGNTTTVPPSGSPDCTFNGRNGYVTNPTVTVAADVDDDSSGHTFCGSDPAVAPIICSGGAYVSGNDYEPPNGSSEGIAALAACNEAGPIDFARSSRKNGGAAIEDDMQFYAFAMGGLTWTRWKGACPGGDAGQPGCAPKNLSKSDLRDIYSCVATDWSQVGGDAEPIVRYAVQAGSGTRSAFETRILGGGISMETGIAGSCTALPAAQILQEHDATGVATADKPAAIYAYDTARWNSQSTGFETDKRNGALLGSINGVAPSPTTLSELEANESDTTACDSNTTGHFCGSRYIFNVVDTPATALEAYQATINFVGVRILAGVDNDHNGSICSGQNKAVISANGFTPLSKIEGGVQTRIDEPSACRLESDLPNGDLEAVNA